MCVQFLLLSHTLWFENSIIVFSYSSGWNGPKMYLLNLKSRFLQSLTPSGDPRNAEFFCLFSCWKPLAFSWLLVSPSLHLQSIWLQDYLSLTAIRLLIPPSWGSSKIPAGCFRHLLHLRIFTLITPTKPPLPCNTYKLGDWIGVSPGTIILSATKCNDISGERAS